MKSIISLFLCFCFLILTATSLTSCFDNRNGTTSDEGKEDSDTSISVPEYKDYERGTVNFSEITYYRPDAEKTIEEFDAVTEAIGKNEISYEEQLNAVYGLESGYYDFITMATYANICYHKNLEDAYWQNEHEVLSTIYPSFSNAVEDLFVAAAKSPHSERFEEDYFGDGLIEDYADGGKYTDNVVLLMENEAELEADYQEISTATVEISYLGKSGTVDSVLDYYKKTYGADSSAYKRAERDCMELYNTVSTEKSKEILIELFKVRRKISDEFGYESYQTFAYETIYHDYTESEFLNFADDVSEFVLPVYIELSNRIFNMQASKTPRKVSKVELINNTYSALKNTNDSLGSIFEYMLQHSLYDIEVYNEDRFDGAYTAYLDNFNAPFIFASTNGDLTDYSTLIHEFGHFADAYYNYNSPTSLDLSEVSSQALEFLMISKLRGILSDDDVDYLLLRQMEELLSVLIFQGFYAVFEHIAYDISLENINEKSLNLAVIKAANKMGLNASYINSIEYVLIPHTALYPFYVQSYCTSAAASLEIYFAELENEGEGFRIYENLIKRSEEDLTFIEYLELANLSSPFTDNRLKYLADKVYFKLRGSHYFIESDGGGNQT